MFGDWCFIIIICEVRIDWSIDLRNLLFLWRIKNFLNNVLDSGIKDVGVMLWWVFFVEDIIIVVKEIGGYCIRLNIILDDIM